MKRFKGIFLSVSAALILLSFFNCFLLKEKYREKLLIDGKIGSGPGEIRWETIDYLPTGPTSFGINKKGEIFILDYLNHRVVKFDSKGNYIEDLPQGGNQNPMDIAFDSNDNIYIEYMSGDVALYDYGMGFIRILNLKPHVPPIIPKMTHLEATDRSTVLLVDPDLDQVDQIIEVDTNGNLIKIRDKFKGYIESKGGYYINNTSSGSSDMMVYNADNKAILPLKKLKAGEGIPEIIGVDSLKNLYFLIAMKKSMKDRVVKVNYRGWRKADFLIRTSPGHADVCRTVRVSPGGKVYVLDDADDKFHLWEYGP